VSGMFFRMLLKISKAELANLMPKRKALKLIVGRRDLRTKQRRCKGYKTKYSLITDPTSGTGSSSFYMYASNALSALIS
jgi:hypothetical protein